MHRRIRRRRRIALAVACCVPTLLVAAVWALSATTSLLAPGRALPQRTAVGVAGNQIQVFNASNAVEPEDVPAEDRPPAGAAGVGGRRVTDRSRAAGIIELAEGVEWHRTFATHFTMVGIPLWLLLLCTSPLLLVAAWQVHRVRSARRPPEGVCANCGRELNPGDARCPECGRAVPSADPLGRVFLADGGTGLSALEPRKPT